jgi:hypothetical protein
LVMSTTEESPGESAMAPSSLLVDHNSPYSCLGEHQEEIKRDQRFMMSPLSLNRSCYFQKLLVLALVIRLTAE